MMNWRDFMRRFIIEGMPRGIMSSQKDKFGRCPPLMAGHGAIDYISNRYGIFGLKIVDKFGHFCL